MFWVLLAGVIVVSGFFIWKKNKKVITKDATQIAKDVGIKINTTGSSSTVNKS